MDVIIYDFEVFKYDWLVVFRNITQRKRIVIENDPEALREYYDENKTAIFAGYNVKYYDTHIFRAIMSGLDPAEVTKSIIEDKVPGWKIPGIKRYPILTYDLSQDIQGAPFLSLKEAEGNMGLSIVETTIPFDIDRKLTFEELDEVEYYCDYDTYATERLFEARFEDFKASMLLIQEFDLGIENIDKTTAQLTALILGAKKGRKIYDELIYDLPDEVQVNNQDIVDLYTQGPLDYKKTLKVDIAGIEHKLAYGGLHGARKQYNAKTLLLLLDVTSYYPSLMIKYNYMSRNARHPERFEQIYNQRVEYKAQGHYMAYPLKIAIAATFGCMKNQYNNMYDPKQPNQICISGQLFLVDLIEKLEPYVKLVQSNTDGILVEPNMDYIETIKDIVNEWETRTGMNLEWEWGTGIWQKDVNNYVMLHEDGGITVKGGYVVNHKGGDYRKNSMSIVDKAVVNYMVYGTDPYVTIHEEQDLISFQQIAKAGATFSHNVHVVQEGLELPVNKVNRVFATTDKSKGKVYKVKEGKLHATPGISDHVVIYNDSIEGKTVNDLPELDKDWYVEQAWNRISDFGLERKIL